METPPWEILASAEEFLITISAVRPAPRRSCVAASAATPRGLAAALMSDASTTIRESTIQNNVASYGGGGVSKNSGTLNIIGSTISGNTANEGGGLYTRYGTTTVSNSTISGNTATFREGGGIRAPLRADAAELFVNHSTIIDNTAVQDTGGGISLNVDIRCKWWESLD